jgi:ribosomal protein S18 acetylase RimI-like enzyme
MREGRRPFGADAYHLRGCALERLRATEDARLLADMLVRLDPWRTLGYTADGLARYFLRDDPGLHRYRIVAGSATAGVVCVRHPWLRGAYIELIGLDPVVQAKGFGGDVVAWIEDETRSEAANLWAFVSASNAPARRFYARQGFVKIAPVADLVAPGYAEILLRKVLRADPAGIDDQRSGRSGW